MLLHAAKQTCGRLERPLKIARGRHTPDPDLGHVGLHGIFQRKNTLDHETARMSVGRIHTGSCSQSTSASDPPSTSPSEYHAYSC